VAAGPITRGRFEAYFRWFRWLALPLVHRRRVVLDLLEPRDEEARVRFYDRRWDGWRWRLLFRVFFGRFVMGRLGRDPEFFRQVEGSVAERILERTRYALTRLPVHDNPWIQQILIGRFRTALPPYLAPESVERLRGSFDRLTLHHGPIDESAEVHAGAGFDGFNLSDMFEYLDPAACEAVYERLLESARPGALFAYWNLLVPRRVPRRFADRVTPLAERARELFARDRAFFYQDFVLEELAA